MTSVLENPDKVERSFRSRKLLQKKFGDKILEVVIKKENNRIIAVTAYYLIKGKDEN